MFGRSFQLSLIGLILLYLQLCSGRCPSHCDSNVKNFDLSELAGRWYVVAASPVRHTVNTCIYFDIVVIGPNTFSMNFTSASYPNARTFSWSVVGLKTGNKLSELWQMNGSPNIFGPFFQKLLAMDTNSYCALITCTDHNPTMYRDSFGMVLSRAKRLVDADLLSMKEKISYYINETEIVDVPNLCWK
ncbi:uncharacterized protein LOC123266782 [Cotesia glomerata]|uniref:Lipocalin/cytosolic fatty-acid binding domain-containing protein n=1 Tax=Cotesia glomerata TaxID=32391 RepID=A0AAV7HS42_COTGL|nr:uncharacterized protein LOC123266782 [Cotesia glomerata]KAH0534670.1 hypothetical protein KQX54_006505 [Cotesia glomerata]